MGSGPRRAWCDCHLTLIMGSTVTILSKEEIAKLPQAGRPMCYRVTSEIYHKVFEAVGAASLCWNPKPNRLVFDASTAEKIATDLCFQIADELERLGVDPKKINPDAPEVPK